LAPIRHLMLEVKRCTVGSSEAQIAAALDLVGTLRRHDAGYFIMNAMAAHHAEAMLGLDRAYLAHEYLVERAELPHFSDVAALLAPAGLSFAASAALLDNFDQYAAPEAVRPLIAQVDDPVLRETVRDFAANRKFRRDIYSRGTGELSPRQRRRMLSTLSFALAVPRPRLTLQFLGPVGDITLKPEFHAAVADMLAQRIATFDELLSLPAFGHDRGDLLTECLALLIHSGQVLPVPDGAVPDAAPAQRFNRMVIARARAGQRYGHLAAPFVRTGIPVDEFGLLALAALSDGYGEPPAAARHALSALVGRGQRPRQKDTPIEDDGAAMAFLTERIELVLREQLPLWRRLGVL
jgi:hypothetical protein